jgi:hypothetical protein
MQPAVRISHSSTLASWLAQWQQIWKDAARLRHRSWRSTYHLLSMRVLSDRVGSRGLSTN